MIEGNLHKPRGRWWTLSKYGLIALGVLLLGTCLFANTLLGLYFDWSHRNSPEYRNYERIRIGMTVDEVQAILGPGTPVEQEIVPQIVVPVNPADAEASMERARQAGGPPPTARDYPTRSKPVVEGDYILRWEDGHGQWRILVAFKEGKVCEKNFWRLSL